MSAIWQVQDAKNRFSELVDKARSSGPQTVTRHGRKVAVVVSQEEFEKLKARHAPARSLVEVLRAAPKELGEIDFSGLRKIEPPRRLDL